MRSLGEKLQNHVNEEHHWRAFWKFFLEQQQNHKKKNWKKIWDHWEEIKSAELYKKKDESGDSVLYFFKSEKLIDYYLKPHSRRAFEK
eukprot:UN04758